jgi:hypothetical protein
VKPFLVYPGDPIFDPIASLSFVMPGLVPGIHVLVFIRTERRGCLGTRFPSSVVLFILRKSGKPDLR